MKVLFGVAWFLLAAATVLSVFALRFDPAALVVVSLIALALVYVLALWSAVGSTRELNNQSKS